MIHQPCPEMLRDKRLLSIDIETTGLSRYSFIIEIGVVEFVNGKLTNEFSKLFGGGHSSMYLVRNVHKIKDSSRRMFPTFKSCAERISDYLSHSIIVAHNGNSFDIPMIQRKLSEAGHPMHDFQSIDTLQLVRKMRKNEQSSEASVSSRNTLGNLCREFGLDYGGEDGSKSHRGLEDSEACLDLLFYLVNNKRISLKIQ